MLDIRPVSDLRNNFASVEKTVQKSDKPIILTKNGRGSMVVMSMEAYSNLSHDAYIENALREADEYAATHAERLSGEQVFGKLRAKIHATKKT